ncbi:phage tail assembly protein [Zooshikella ganghwensis]|uniref:Phage tail assembly protein n=1 Tax=Zooshikella ganghwensis TaxID=202772 RepID=A0A4P9VU53_9GAMM|nr:phage tail assembly protein [Zooshikella ganghwensis]RDH45822.1 phage tail assembly protein [Zooshikella ganghwensis]
MKQLFKLEYPITVNGEEIKEINFRRPTAKDMKAIEQMGGGDIEGSINLLSMLSGIDINSIENLDVNDFRKINDYMNKYFFLD